MSSGRSRSWMWADAVFLMEHLERQHRNQAFAPTHGVTGKPAWEPPVDMLETATHLLVLVALPGVDPQQAEAFIEDGVLVVRGRRVLPPQLRGARVHRLELPQGRFERRVQLPAGRYGDVARSSLHGCLLVTLTKTENGGRP